MFINNLERVISLIKFYDNDVYYTAKIIIRKKDFKDVNEYYKIFGHGNKALIQEKVLTNDNYIEYLSQLVELCKIIPNSRVYFTLNPKSFRKTTINIIDKFNNGLKCQLFDSKFNFPKYVSKITKVSRAESESDFHRNHTYKLVDLDNETNVELLGNYATIKTVNGYHYIFKFKDFLAFKNDNLNILDGYNFEVKDNASTLVFANMN